MSLKQLQDYTFCSKYARFNAEAHRRETYEEAVNRVFSMHEKRYGGKGIDDAIAFAKAAALDRLVLGSQRALQFGGKPIENKHARQYNCAVSYCDRPRFFQETLWLLLCGCGVGFSVQHHHVAKLSGIRQPYKDQVTYVIPDSIEGWADALGVLMSSYFINGGPFDEWHGVPVEFDYSLIRPKGRDISSGSGKAPGPEPLKRSLDLIRELLDRQIQERGDAIMLRPIDCYDVIMHASDAVLSGGVRRSATICLFSPDDQEMATAKTGDWFISNAQRGRSNNSAVLVRDQTSFEQFMTLMNSVKEFGEPGFVWADSTEVLFNPCCEIGMMPTITLREAIQVHPGGAWPTAEIQVNPGQVLSGVQFCNLCEINAKLCRDPETFFRACTAAAILGTLQAGYTDFEYLGPVSEAITIRESLLGVSMTGIMDSPDIVLDPEIQRRGAEVVKAINADIAAKIGIPSAARTTCVKPAGSTSCVLGTASGIHPHHAKRYFRRVQANMTEAPYQYFQAHNPRAVEMSVWNPNGTDAVITFCVEVPSKARVKNDMSAVDLLETVKLTQQNWVEYGTRIEQCAAPWLRHNVSNTITVRDNEWDEVAHFIFDNRASFAGISLLPMGGDMDYPQAPFCAVWTFPEIVKEYGVGSMFASGLIVDGLHVFNQDLWAACACALGTGKPFESLTTEQQDWVRRSRKFAKNYFDDDVKRMTYCLKRVSLAKLWEDLHREDTPVDYTLMLEDTDQTKPSETVACSGGACELI